MTEPARNASPLQTDPQLQRYFASEEERRVNTRKLFDSAASGYDRAENITALGTGPWYRRWALQRSGLTAGMTVLDVAAGTGLVAREAQHIIGDKGRLMALDPSPGMLDELRKKLAVETIEAYAESIPLPENNVDFVSMGYALRHVGSLEQAFGEYLRVLRPGGRTCVMEITRPRSAFGRLMMRIYIRGIVPLLSRVARCNPDVSMLWEYYWDTIQAAVEPERVLEAMRQAGFEDVRCMLTLGVFREYVGRKPVTA
ncbi:MAG: dimethylmenaquinone methyltransferase [Betaproteobacteria bacterium HGW-Betaproteobacteria-13]|jgi:demethylmenaquinone methyltransferase/2-methoxy-6-polyprenyl-1,4-benzoquinol methylase|uniref:Dimethylmenaquinone methyltransferase n=1 Tax=Parazoarcus communis TaxID=41977 RepID=A0A2U8GZQ6_9RHOO|nr:class I SAM-dependent methyltransferase [Parazoarcus communis]AWI79192.1 dimethylmenaquinone methyltransferase [Parazoarcus communis]PKO81657.1 MAG: dimethylmenaquinone methyltransferase [Betaproteobacteria bacterium HGW-Betaproteobacteria-13]